MKKNLRCVGCGRRRKKSHDKRNRDHVASCNEHARQVRAARRKP